MNIKFDTNVDFKSKYTLEDGHEVEVEVKDGTVSFNIKPVFTSGYLQTSVDFQDIPHWYCDEYTVTTATTQNDTDNEKEDEDDYDIIIDSFDDDFFDDEVETEDENCEDVEPNYELASKIAKYDKDGKITRLLTSLLNKTDKASEELVGKISRIMLNLTEELGKIEHKLKEELE